MNLGRLNQGNLKKTKNSWLGVPHSRFKLGLSQEIDGPNEVLSPKKFKTKHLLASKIVGPKKLWS